MTSIINMPIEIVGTDEKDHGRTCNLHKESCGASLTIDHPFLKIHKKTIQIFKIPMSSNQPHSKGVSKKLKGKAKKQANSDSQESQLVDHHTMGVYIYNNNVSSCFVGFVSKTFQSVYGDKLEGRILKIQRILKGSDSESERLRSNYYHGLIHTIIIG